MPPRGRHAEGSSDLDLLSLHGLDFPRYRGSPMLHVGTVDARHVHETMKRFQEVHRDRLEPAALLERLGLP